MASRSAVVVAGASRAASSSSPRGGDLVAGQPDELVLAGEVGVDRPDRQAALADDVGDGRAVVALLGEDAGGGVEDPVADLLLVGGTDARHIDS